MGAAAGDAARPGAGPALVVSFVITAIAWIGSSFYFVFLDNNLIKPNSPDLLEKGVRDVLSSKKAKPSEKVAAISAGWCRPARARGVVRGSLGAGANLRCKGADVFCGGRDVTFPLSWFQHFGAVARFGSHWLFHILIDFCRVDLMSSFYIYLDYERYELVSYVPVR